MSFNAFQLIESHDLTTYPVDSYNGNGLFVLQSGICLTFRHGHLIIITKVERLTHAYPSKKKPYPINNFLDVPNSEEGQE